jgi:Tol biopolymer transport system component
MRNCLKLLALLLAMGGIVWAGTSCGLESRSSIGRIAFVTSPKGTSGRVVATATRPSPDVLAIGELGRCLTRSVHDQLWSRNGRLVCFEGAYRDPLTWLDVVDANGNNRRRLVDVEGLDLSSLSISPDGKKVLIAYHDSRTVETPFQGSVRVDTIRFSAVDSIDTANGTVRHLASVDNTSIDRAVFSPNGQRIAFVGRTDDPNTHYNIYVMNADGSNMRRLTDLDAEMNPFEPPRWSANGREILYSYETLFIDDITHYDDLFRVDVASGRSTNLTNTPKDDDGQYSWSPDGRQIAFTSVNNSAMWAIYLMDADGGNRRKVADHAGAPSWLSDGRHILASGSAYDEATGRWMGAGILEIDVKTGETRTVVPLQDAYSSLSAPLSLGK